MNKRYWIGLTLAATLALSGCQSDAPNFKWDYLSKLYDGARFKGKEPPKMLSEKEMSVIMEECRSKAVKAPKNYSYGDTFSVVMTAPFEDYLGQMARYVQSGEQTYLYCQNMADSEYHLLSTKQDVFAKTKLVEHPNELEVHPDTIKKEDWFSRDDNIINGSVRKLALPGSGYLVMKATDVTKKDERKTFVVYAEALTPFTEDTKLYLTYNEKYNENDDISYNSFVRIPQLISGQQMETSIHAMKQPGKVRFIPGDGTPEHYGTLIATEKNGHRFRYELSIQHTMERPSELARQDLSEEDVLSTINDITLFHQKQFKHYLYDQSDSSKDRLKVEDTIMMTSDESGKLQKAIKSSEQADVRGKRAKWKYLTFRKGVKGQQYEVYLDKRVKKTDIYLKDPKRDVSIHLSASGRDIILSLFELYEK